MPYNQKDITEQAKFEYSPLGKAFEKQTKMTEDQRIKVVEALKALKPKEKLEWIFPKNIRNQKLKRKIK